MPTGCLRCGFLIPAGSQRCPSCGFKTPETRIREAREREETLKKLPGTVVRIEEAQAFVRWRRWKTLYYAAYFALAWLIFYGLGTLILPAETQRASSWLLFVTGLALGGAWALGRWNERGPRRSSRSAEPPEEPG